MAAGIFGLLGIVCSCAWWHCFGQSQRLKKGLDGRTKVLFAMILLEGLFLIVFSQMNTCSACNPCNDSIRTLTHMACGATSALWCHSLTVML